MLIKIYQNIFDERNEAEIFEVENLALFLFERYGEVPKIPFDLFRGEPDYARCITGEISSVANATYPLYSIIERPAADPISAAAAFKIFIAINTLFYMMTQTQGPKVMPAYVNRNQMSQNNGFGDRSNSHRIFQRKEDVYGQVNAIPSLMMPTYQYYSSVGDKYERGYYSISRGYIDPDIAKQTLKDSKTLLTDIPYCKASFYHPFTAPDGNPATPVFTIGGGVFDKVDMRVENKNTNEITLKAPNESNLTGRAGYAFIANKIVQARETPGFSDVFQAGDTVIVNAPYDWGTTGFGGQPWTNPQGGGGFLENPYYYTFPAGSIVGGIVGPEDSGGIETTTQYNQNIVAWASTAASQQVWFSANASNNTVTFSTTNAPYNENAKDHCLRFYPAVTNWGGTPPQPYTAGLAVGVILRGTFGVTGVRAKILAISYTSNSVTLTLDTPIPTQTNSVCHFGSFANVSGTYKVLGVETEVVDGSYGISYGERQVLTIDSTFPIWMYDGAPDPYAEVNQGTSVNLHFMNAIVTKDFSGLPEVSDAEGYSIYYKIKNNSQTKLQINLASLQGLYKKSTGAPKSTRVEISYKIQRLVNNVGTGTEYIFSQFISSHQPKADDPTGSTRIIDLQAECGFTGPLQIKFKRITYHDYGFQGTVQDEVIVSRTYSIVENDKHHFGNLTTILTEVKLNQKAFSIDNRQLNVEAFRMLPTWNGTSWSGVLDNTGRLISGTLHGTSNPTDIIAAITTDPKIGNRPIGEVDVAQIYETINKIKLWNESCALFNYTFDNDSTTYDQHVAIIANAVFCEEYKQNGKLRLSFDGPQATSAALITQRSKKPGAVDTITRTFFDDNDFDGVQVIYPDPDTLSTETFYLPSDGNFTKAKKVEIAGIRNFIQAWFRGNRELARIKNLRRAISTTMTMEARSFSPNLKVDIVDNTRFKTYSGEVLGINQNTKILSLSDDILFKEGMSHTITLSRRNGSQETIPCNPVIVSGEISTDKVLLEYLPGEPVIVVNGIDGIRTSYAFAAEDDRKSMAYRIRKLTFDEYPYVGVEAVGYNEDDYASDFLPVPDRISIVGA